MRKFFKPPIVAAIAIVSLTAYWAVTTMDTDPPRQLPAKPTDLALTQAQADTNPSQPVANMALATDAASDAKLAALSAQVAELKNSVAALQHSLQIQTRRVDSALSKAAHNAPPDQDPTPEQLHAIQASRAQVSQEAQIQAEYYKASVESHFSQEPENPAWAASAASQVAASFANGQYGTAAIRTLTCKSSTCRVELEYDLTPAQSGSPDQSQPEALSNLLNSALSKTENPQTNKGTAVIFIGPDGANLS